jgi:hypothetical protein
MASQLAFNLERRKRMIGKVVYVGSGQVAAACNGNLVPLRLFAAEWNAMDEAWCDIRTIAATMEQFGRMNSSWPCGEDIISMARAINTALERREKAGAQEGEDER